MDFSGREFRTEGVEEKKQKYRENTRGREREKTHTNQSKQPAGIYVNISFMVSRVEQTLSCVCVCVRIKEKCSRVFRVFGPRTLVPCEVVARPWTIEGVRCVTWGRSAFCRRSAEE